MKAKDKKKIQSLLNAIYKVHNKCCELMDEGIVEEYSLDICSLDIVSNELEGVLRCCDAKKITNDHSY